MMMQNLQLEFFQAIMNNIDAPALPHEHMAIYRNNVLNNFLHALKEFYPLINKLLGDDYFCMIAKKYINQYPSCSSNLNDYGEYFADFLNQEPSLQELIYLREVAQFEWVSHQLFFAADATIFNPEKLKLITPEEYSELRFILHPASALLKFEFPILKIIDLCNGNLHESIQLNEGGVNLLMIRRELEITLLPLPLADFNFLNALQNNASLNEAFNLALATDAHFNLEEKLPQWIKDKTLVDFYLEF